MVTLQIWTNRLLREFDGIENRLPAGVTLLSHFMEPEKGVCKAVFQASLVPGAEGEAHLGARGEKRVSNEDNEGKSGDGEELGTLTSSVDEKGLGNEGGNEEEGEEHKVDSVDSGEAGEGGLVMSSPVEFKVEVDLSQDTRYPFEAPVVRVVDGQDVLPTEMQAGDRLIVPDMDSWTPSNTVVVCLQEIMEAVSQASLQGVPVGRGKDEEDLVRGLLREGSILRVESLRGALFPCSLPPTHIRGQLESAQYLGVTDNQLLVLEAHATQLDQAVVVSASDLRQLAKLKFRRGVSVTVVLRGGTSMDYLTPQAYECVQAITERLENKGISGHQTSAVAERHVDKAKSVMANIDRKEKEMENNPSLDLVQEVMDLFRQATELFGAVNDSRHLQVVDQMHAFLQRPEVIAVIESAPLPPSVSTIVAPEEEVLERSFEVSSISEDKTGVVNSSEIDVAVATTEGPGGQEGEVAEGTVVENQKAVPVEAETEAKDAVVTETGAGEEAGAAPGIQVVEKDVKGTGGVVEGPKSVVRKVKPVVGKGRGDGKTVRTTVRSTGGHSSPPMRKGSEEVGARAGGGVGSTRRLSTGSTSSSRVTSTPVGRDDARVRGRGRGTTRGTVRGRGVSSTTKTRVGGVKPPSSKS